MFIFSGVHIIPWACHVRCMGPPERRSWRCQRDSRPRVTVHPCWGFGGRIQRPSEEPEPNTAAFPPLSLDPCPYMSWPPAITDRCHLIPVYSFSYTQVKYPRTTWSFYKIIHFLKGKHTLSVFYTFHIFLATPKTQKGTLLIKFISSCKGKGMYLLPCL